MLSKYMSPHGLVFQSTQFKMKGQVLEQVDAGLQAQPRGSVFWALQDCGTKMRRVQPELICTLGNGAALRHNPAALQHSEPEQTILGEGSWI